MYYGNSGAANQQNAASVWDANYRMVQHLEKTSGTYYDSTANNNNGSPSGVTQGAVGRIDGASSFDGTDDSINCGNSGSLDVLNPITIEAWIKINSYGQVNAGRIFEKTNYSFQGRLLFVDGFDYLKALP